MRTTPARFCASALVLTLFAACGGGGGGGGGGGTTPPPAGPSISFSLDAVNFSVPGVWAPKPADRVLTATLSGTVTGTLYIVVQVNNPELVSVTNIRITGDTTGEATIVPVAPATLGGGSRQGSIVVRACVNDPSCNTGQLSGSPKTIAVTYDVATNIQGDVVAPRVVTAGTSGTVILRGRNFPANPTVAFGATPGTVTSASSTELRVTHPALAAGSYTVAVNSGSAAFGGRLVVVPAQNFSPSFLPYPVATPAFVHALEYDAEREALFVGVSVPAATSRRLLRFARSGGAWIAAAQVDVADLRQVRLAQDGSRLLVLRSQSAPATTFIDELDPVSLATLRSTPFGAGLWIRSFALTNDGNALIATANFGSGASPPYLYSVPGRTFQALPGLVQQWDVAASGNGAFAAWLFEGPRYRPSTGALEPGASASSASFEEPVTVDLAGTRVQSGTGVLDGNLQAIGYVDATQVAAVVDPAGTRVYSLDPGATLRTWNVALPASGGGAFPRFTEIGAAIPLVADPGTQTTPRPRMAITPDGRTVFVAGINGVAVQPTP